MVKVEFTDKTGRVFKRTTRHAYAAGFVVRGPDGEVTCSGFSQDAATAEKTAANQRRRYSEVAPTGDWHSAKERAACRAKNAANAARYTVEVYETRLEVAAE